MQLYFDNLKDSNKVKNETIRSYLSALNWYITNIKKSSEISIEIGRKENIYLTMVKVDEFKQMVATA